MTGLVELTLGRVARLTLVNPPLNLVTGELLDELNESLSTLEAAAPGDVRAVVVTGDGERAFSAGSHVGEFEAQRGPGGRERLELEERTSTRLAGLPMPTIAAIEGNALGGGLELALACDLRIASSRAKLGLPEVRLAVIPGAGGTQRLPRLVGLARAKELILTGRTIDAGEAHAHGLVNAVYEPQELMAKSLETARELAKLSPIALAAAKAAANRALQGHHADNLAAEADHFGELFSSEDAKEGLTAFVEKRAARFTGR